MGKYKVLLVGNNNAAKNDFFNQMGDAFFLLSSSMRHDDMINHLNLFSPEIVVFCVSDKMQEDWTSIIAYRQRIIEDEIVTVVIGSEEGCDNFKRIAINIGNLVLRQPITASVIKERIVGYMEQREQEKEEERIQQEALAQEEEKKRRKHVLVIDDDALMLKMIKEHLHEKYDVATAISGKIAHKFLETKTTDLILLDYEMPEENGPEVLAKIKRNKKLTKIPVIFLTGITEKEKITQALKLKPQGYLLKPIEKDKLLETIEKYIG